MQFTTGAVAESATERLFNLKVNGELIPGVILMPGPSCDHAAFVLLDHAQNDMGKDGPVGYWNDSIDGAMGINEVWILMLQTLK